MMKKIPFVLAILISSSLPTLANEYVSPYNLAAVGDKAYIVEINEATNTQTLVQYSFPDLVETKRLDLGANFPFVTASDKGIIVSSYTTSDTPVEPKPDQILPKGAKLYQEIYTTDTYDTSLMKKGTISKTNQFYYIFETLELQPSSLALDAKIPQSKISVDKSFCEDTGKKKSKKGSCNRVSITSK